MLRFMVLTFALLGWAFYELSGGAEFAPPEVVPAPRIVTRAEAGPLPAPEPAPAAIPAVYAAPVVTAPSEFAPEPVPVAAEPAVAEPPKEVREVVGSRVNMRTGPGTSHDVVTVLSRGDAAEVVEIVGRWALIRAGGTEGWMALSMLSEPI